MNYRVAQQCCSCRNCPETPRRVLRSVFRGVSGRFSPGNPPQCTKKCYRGASGGSTDDFRQDNIAEPHGIQALAVFDRLTKKLEIENYSCKM